MGLRTQRPKLKLSKEEIDLLQRNGNSRPLPNKRYNVRKYYVLYHQNMGISEIQRRAGRYA